MSVVVRPNFDTLYSSGWLDLTKEPMVVSAPDTGGRYYLLPMLDMWTDVFASPGWRTTGTAGRQFPRHAARLEPDTRRQSRFSCSQRSMRRRPMSGSSAAPRPTDRADYDAVHKIQAGYKITPLSQWGKEPRPVEVKIDPSVDMKTPPKVQVDTMPAGKYFAYAAELLKAASAAHHRPADHRAAEAHRLRAGQELRSRQGRSGRPEGLGKRAGGCAEADGVEGADAWRASPMAGR